MSLSLLCRLSSPRNVFTASRSITDNVRPILPAFQQRSISMSAPPPPSRGGGAGRGGRGRGGPRGGRGAAGGSRGGARGSGAPREQSTLAGSAAPAGASAPLAQPSSTVSTYLSNVTFASLAPQVDARLLSAVPFPIMSDIQAETVKPMLSGVDVLAQAKTGTGKTVAFLLPTIATILSQINAGRAPRPGTITALILSPTRELALQIEKEANMLLKNVAGSLGVQHVVGGTNMGTETKRLGKERCDILVATPGRLIDHMSNPAFNQKFGQLKFLILDEADRMLDMGFRRDLEKIKANLPNRKSVPRQTLLFSATIPPGIREAADLDPNAVMINTLSAEEANVHEHIPQQFLVAPHIDLLPITLALILEELKNLPQAAKIIVFANTARGAGLMAEIFREPKLHAALRAFNPSGSFPVLELHSRLSQTKRVSVMQEFAKAPSAVLFSSDVAARGVDFPGVSLVAQVGLPSSPEQYIHRIGRTGRAGKKGHGVIVLADFEQRFLQHREMKALPLQPHSAELRLEDARALMVTALLNTSDHIKAQAYAASLGYYLPLTKTTGHNKEQCVATWNDWAKRALLYSGGVAALPPPILKKTIGMMGLKGVPGTNVVTELPEGPNKGNAPKAPPAQGNGQGRSARGGGPSRGGGGGRGGGGRGGGGRQAQNPY